MRAVLISGWGTEKGIWKHVAPAVPDSEHICWSQVIRGDFILPNPCIIAGWSLGGQLALDLSERSEVRGIVLVSSMTCLVSGEGRPGIEPERCSMIARMLSRSRKGYLTSFFRECGTSSDEMEELLDMSESFTIEELTAGLAVMFYHTALPSPFIPSVVIHGTADRIVPYETAGYLTGSVLKKAEHIPVNSGEHILPYSHGDLIAKAVNDLAGSLST